MPENHNVFAGLDLELAQGELQAVRDSGNQHILLQLGKPGLELLNFRAPWMPQMASSTRHRCEPGP